MKNISIKTKLFIVIFAIAFIITTFLTIQSVNTINNMANENIKQYTQQLLDEKKESLKNYVDMARGILNIHRDKVTKETTPQELEIIKKQAIKALDSMVYGDDDGYIFIWSYEGVPLAFHPRPDLIGKTLLHLRDPNGLWVIKDHIANAKKGNKGNFYTYKWKTTKDSNYQTKISYSYGVQEWGWFVGTGEYMSREEAQIAAHKKAFEENKNKLIKDIIYKSLIFMILIGFIFYFLVHKMITQPLNILQNGLNDFFRFLQNKIDKVETIEHDTNDEFGKMIKSINENIGVSTKLHNEIKDLNKNLEQKVENKTKELENEKKSFEAIYNGSKDAIAIIDMKSNFLDVNPAYIEMTGFTKEELLNDSYYNLTVEEDKDISKNAIKEVIEVGFIKNFEKRCIIKNNKIMIVNMSMSLLTNPNRILLSVRDITKIKNDEKLLYEAKEKAEESTKAKSEFLANMSHEIRTPMNGIIGMSHLTLQTNLDSKQKKYLHNIDSSAKSLLNIINDILDFSKIEAGKLNIEKIDFNMSEVINKVVNIIEFKASDKNLELKVYYDESIGKNFYGDSLRLSQILVNLLSNAVKFTSKGEVGIYIRKVEENRYSFEIKDTGIGLSEVQQSKLFKSFSQADGSTTRKHGGTGLGLTISKQLVELMNGKIWIESTLHVGSSFIFEIELDRIEDDKFEKQILDNKSYKNNIKLLKNSKILLTEDNFINQEIILGLLEKSEIDIDIANNGQEAVDKYIANPNKYELILMDLQMPIMGGLEATKLIREIDKNIPIIALTANAMNEDVEATQEAGMNEHLNKPIEVEKLFETLLKYILKKS